MHRTQWQGYVWRSLGQCIIFQHILDIYLYRSSLIAQPVARCRVRLGTMIQPISQRRAETHMESPLHSGLQKLIHRETSKGETVHISALAQVCTRQSQGRESSCMRRWDPVSFRSKECELFHLVTISGILHKSTMTDDACAKYSGSHHTRRGLGKSFPGWWSSLQVQSGSTEPWKSHGLRCR